MISHFTAHTIYCECHSIRLMLRVLGIYNFGLDKENGLKIVDEHANTTINWYENAKDFFLSRQLYLKLEVKSFCLSSRTQDTK